MKTIWTGIDKEVKKNVVKYRNQIIEVQDIEGCNEAMDAIILSVYLNGENNGLREAMGKPIKF